MATLTRPTVNVSAKDISFIPSEETKYKRPIQFRGAQREGTIVLQPSEPAPTFTAPPPPQKQLSGGALLSQSPLIESKQAAPTVTAVSQGALVSAPLQPPVIQEQRVAMPVTQVQEEPQRTEVVYAPATVTKTQTTVQQVPAHTQITTRVITERPPMLEEGPPKRETGIMGAIKEAWYEFQLDKYYNRVLKDKTALDFDRQKLEEDIQRLRAYQSSINYGQVAGQERIAPSGPVITSTVQEINMEVNVVEDKKRLLDDQAQMVRDFQRLIYYHTKLSQTNPTSASKYMVNIEYNPNLHTWSVQ